MQGWAKAQPFEYLRLVIQERPCARLDFGVLKVDPSETMKKSRVPSLRAREVFVEGFE